MFVWATSRRTSAASAGPAMPRPAGSCEGRLDEQSADRVLDVAGAFFGAGDVDSGLEFGADRDPAGGQVQDEAEQEARVEVRGQVAVLLGLGDRVDLGAGVGDTGRAGLAVGAFQSLPGAQAHDLG